MHNDMKAVHGHKVRNTVLVVAGGREKYPAMGYWLPTETQTLPEAGSSFIQNLYFN